MREAGGELGHNVGHPRWLRARQVAEPQARAHHEAKGPRIISHGLTEWSHRHGSATSILIVGQIVTVNNWAAIVSKRCNRATVRSCKIWDF